MEIVNDVPSHVPYFFDFSDPSLHYRSTDSKESSWQPAFLQALEPHVGFPLPTVEAPSPCSESHSGTSPQGSLLRSTITQDSRRHSMVRVKEKLPASSTRLSCHPYVRHALPTNPVVKGENGSVVTGSLIQNSKLMDSGFLSGSPPSYNSVYEEHLNHSDNAQLSCALPGPGMISSPLQSFSDGESVHRYHGSNNGDLKTPASTHASSDGSASSVAVGGASEGCHLEQLLDFMLADSQTTESSHDALKTWFPESSIHAPLPSHDSLLHPNNGSRAGKLSDCFSKLHRKIAFNKGEGVVSEKFLDGFQSAITQGLTTSTENAIVQSGLIAETPSMEDVGMWDRCRKIYNGLEEIFGHQRGVNEGSESLYEAYSRYGQNQVKPLAGSTYGTIGQCCPPIHDYLHCAKEEQSCDDSWQAKVAEVNAGISYGEGEGIDKSCDSLIPQTPGQVSFKDNVKTEFGKIRGFALTPFLDSQQQHMGVKAESDYSEICLVHLLVAGAEAVAARDMDLASVILVRLKELVSCPGSTMRRVAAYFSDGLQCRIEGGQPLKHPPKIGSRSDILAAFQILHEISPYIKFGHFTANQAILEAIEGEKRVHIVDYEIMEGIQWPAFMQALVLRKGGPPQQLRITALCRIHHMDRGLTVAVQETGKRLTDFASSLKLSFSFGLLKVENEEEFSASSLKLVKGEALVVNCMLQLPHMPHRTATSVSSFLRGMRKLSPIVLSLVEEELGCSNTAVASYFFEALHHYSAICDSLEACLSNEIMARMLVERVFLQPRISSAVTMWSRSCTTNAAADRGTDLTTYNWCSLVRSVGFKSLPLSFHNLSQARLLLGLYRDGFKLDERSNRLLLGWRSKHLFAASVWN